MTQRQRIQRRGPGRWIGTSRIVVACFVLAPTASGQCDRVWWPINPPGFDGQVLAIGRWDPDGTGPLPPVLVAGGRFTHAGSVSAESIAFWRDGEWHPLGAGFPSSINPVVLSIATLPDGSLVVGGLLSVINGVAYNGIARWNGAAWLPMNGGMGGVAGGTPSVNALAVLPNGDLIAGGDFSSAGGVPAQRIARWDGAAWHPLGSGIDSSVGVLLATPNGDLYAGGGFTSAGGVSSNSIARWDGGAWSPLGAGISQFQYGRTVCSLALLPGGDLVAGGTFTSAGGVPVGCVARWDGAQWYWMGYGMNGSGGYANVASLSVLDDGTLVAAGDYSGNQTVWRWTGTGWVSLGAGAGGAGSPVASAVMPNGDLWIGGRFSALGGRLTPYIAVYGSPCRCPVDLDNGSGLGSAESTKDGAVTIDDLLYFLAAFTASDSHADLDDGSGAGTPDGAVTIEDLLFFLDHFEAGC